MKKYSVIGIIVCISIWLLISWTKIIDPFFLPSSWLVLEQLLKGLINGILLNHLFQTLIRTFAAFILAIIVGLPTGLFLGNSEKTYRSLEFIIDFFRSTPATALFPLSMLIFGIHDISKISIAAFSACLIIIFNTAYGVMNARQSRILAAQIMGATKFQIFKWILFWESLPQTFIGLRGALSMSLMVIVVTEMFIGTEVGLGRKIIDAQITYDIPMMYAVIILSGIVGYLFNLSAFLIEKKIVHWK